MARERIEKLINELDNISEKHTDNEFNIAVYIYCRCGIFTFNNYINENDLEMIENEIKQHESIFNEDLNYKVTRILERED